MIETIKGSILRVEQFIDMLDRLKPEKHFNIDAIFPGKINSTFSITIDTHYILVMYRKCIENCFEGHDGRETFSVFYSNPAAVVHEVCSIFFHLMICFSSSRFWEF